MKNRDRDPARTKTLQDDRDELGTDAEDESELVARPDAPLAEDAVIDEDSTQKTAPTASSPALLGGAPVPVPIENVGPSHDMTARDDRPIDD